MSDDEASFDDNDDQNAEIGDLSLFSKAMGEINDADKPNEIAIIRQVLEQVAKEFGIEINPFDGHAIGQPMALNHRLDDLRMEEGLSEDQIDAIQQNEFTFQLASEILDELLDEDRLLPLNDKELEVKSNTVNLLIEALVYFGEESFDRENDFVTFQKEKMIADIRSYDLILSTFHRYSKFLEEYSQRRPEMDREIVSLSDSINHYILNITPERLVKLDTYMPGYASAYQKIEKSIKDALTEVKGDDLLGSELRVLVRTARECIQTTLSISEGSKTQLNKEALERLIADIKSA